MELKTDSAGEISTYLTLLSTQHTQIFFMSISLSFLLYFSQTHTKRIKLDISGLPEALDVAGYDGEYSLTILAYSIYCMAYTGIKAHTQWY